MSIYDCCRTIKPPDKKTIEETDEDFGIIGRGSRPVVRKSDD